MNKFISHFFHHIIIFVHETIVYPLADNSALVFRVLPKSETMFPDTIPTACAKSWTKDLIFRYTKTTTLSGVRPSGANRPIKIPM